MQQAVFLFTQIFFVLLAISAIGIVIFTLIKNKDNKIATGKHLSSESTDKK